VLSLVGKPTVLRPGGVTIEQLRKYIPQLGVKTVVKKSEQPKAPGMKYSHYAPKTKLILVLPPNTAVKIKALMELFRHKKVGILCWTPHAYQYHKAHMVVQPLGKTMHETAHNLFSALRALDDKNVDIILAEGVAEKGIGLAVMNRLRRAAVKIV